MTKEDAPAEKTGLLLGRQNSTDSTGKMLNRRHTVGATHIRTAGHLEKVSHENFIDAKLTILTHTNYLSVAGN